ncbi:MAG: hypothetical protein FWC50_07385 [Planctomycetaceae bacterium]|nr:hypothetical protein [Planctomycetaceae bacterium]
MTSPTRFLYQGTSENSFDEPEFAIPASSKCGVFEYESTLRSNIARLMENEVLK